MVLPQAAAETLAEVDYVVVGAGSAGCLLAARLSENQRVSVALIEAGPRSRNPLLSVPLLTGWFLRSGAYNWGFETTPQPGLAGRSLKWPRGKLVGGSGAINGMVWARGLPSDFDRWGQMGLTDWSWDKIRPIFEALEAPGRGGGEGPLGISEPEWWSPLYDAFLDAAASAGYGRTENFNGDAPTGAGRYRFNIRGGRRASTARAYLSAASSRANLTIIPDHQVQAVTFEAGRATGVRIAARGGAVRTVKARREIVLSAGTIGSPHILMLSGIGDAQQLAEHGIGVVVDRPEVGRNLQEHLLVRVEHEALKSGGLNDLLRADRAMLALARALLFGKGPAACFPLLVGGFFKSRPDLEDPDLQSHFLPALSSATIRVNPFRMPTGARPTDGYFANIYQMRPQSRGSVSLRSGDPMEAPIIDPAYLSAKSDLDHMIEGVKLLRRVFAEPAFDPWRGRELSPGPEIVTDDEIADWVRQTADTVYHPTSTCRMGIDPDSVVDAELKVRGVDGLRVADASVMPAITSANTNAPTIMIAERAARLMSS